MHKYASADAHADADTKADTDVNAGVDADAETLMFDEFMVCLALCGSFKYAEVKVPTEEDPEAGMDLGKFQKQFDCLYSQVSLDPFRFGPLESFKSKSVSGVRGFSGALYSLMWAQLALLALNWKEMPYRLARLGGAIALAV